MNFAENKIADKLKEESKDKLKEELVNKTLVVKDDTVIKDPSSDDIDAMFNDPLFGEVNFNIMEELLYGESSSKFDEKRSKELKDVGLLLTFMALELINKHKFEMKDAISMVIDNNYNE